MFSNPLSQNNFSDPFITYDKKTGYYYFLASCQCNQLTVYRSKTVGDILTNGESKVVYECGSNGIFGPMWAPEMYKIGNRWYIYTSCRDHWEDNLFAVRKQPLILQSKTEDPFDGFTFGTKPDPSIFAIDPSCAVIDGKQYICYSQVVPGGIQALVIREMLDPLTFTDRYAEIARPSLPWELAEGYTDCPINEGAFFIQKGERLFIIYSANGCWSDDYCLGVLEHTGGEICDANNWKKHPKPLFVKGNGVYGVGHASFFLSPDESELWCAYHCLLRSNPERKDMDRHTCIQRISFDENDYPVMGAPVGVNKTIPSPSGEILFTKVEFKSRTAV